MYSKFLKLIKTNKHYDYNCYATSQKADISENKTFNRFFEAVKSWNWKLIDKFVNNGANINACLVITGPQAGSTALHFACIDDDDDKALKLLEDYEVNVNSVGDDGAQPLYLACLLGHERIVNVLLDSDANPDVEFSKKIHEKYAEFGERWSDDFGGKMTLLTFVVINNDEYLTHRILK
ncbi:hypothetical protein G9C98_002945 [Cotesia typhae]|uniref:Uncharacterized protein n=1 Tax=Cotesia typhae TaxID=2053667 RepID=A0A8J5R4M0_9HYME|nr:hypothetical protein G9C98_002945 [Cotesia typhae]